ncbi:MAG: hypothetical protein RL684_3287, partial [Pseudomonadota bacterium]
RQWISDGALAPVAAAAAGGEFAALVVSPAPGEMLDDPPARIVLGFNGELDQTRLDAGSLLLERLGTGPADAAQPLPLRLRVPAGNVQALLVEPLQRLAPGRYRLSVPAAPATGIASIAGGRLGGARVDSMPLTQFDVLPQPAPAHAQEPTP